MGPRRAIANVPYRLLTRHCRPAHSRWHCSFVATNISGGLAPRAAIRLLLKTSAVHRDQELPFSPFLVAAPDAKTDDAARRLHARFFQLTAATASISTRKSDPASFADSTVVLAGSWGPR
jgi:hypothetical protein